LGCPDATKEGSRGLRSEPGSDSGLTLFFASIDAGRASYCRHTYATWSLAAGVSLFNLSRRMGTSAAMIDATYGHLAPDAEEYERALLNAYDNRESGAERSAR
jgi:hypothetical protein